MPAVATSLKRVVVEHPSGLRQILAAVEQQPDPIIQARFSLGTIHDRLVSLGLVAAKRGYYLFRVVGQTPTNSVPAAPAL